MAYDDEAANDYFRSQGLVLNAEGTEWVKPSTPESSEPSPAEIAAYRVARGVKHSNPLPVQDDRGSPFSGPADPARPSYIMEPDLQEAQGGMHLPPGLMQEDSGRFYYHDDPAKTVPMVQRPGLIPFANTPEGYKLVMPKMLDLVGNVMGNVAAPRVAAKAGEMVLGSGMVRTAQEAKAIEAAEPFYSALERTVQQAKINLATPEQWLGYLKNQPGVKSEELNHVLGELPKDGMLSKAQLEDVVKQNKVELKEKVLGSKDLTVIPHEDEPHILQVFRSDDPTGERSGMVGEIIKQKNGMYKLNVPELAKAEFVSQQDAENYIKKHTDFAQTTKYHAYQLPGGENYKEMLLSLPPSQNEQQISKLIKRMDELSETPWNEFKKNEDAINKEYGELQTKVLKLRDDAFNNRNGEQFKAPHFDDNGTNLLAHIRMNDRKLPVEFTAEEKAALQKHEEAQPYLDKLKQSQADVGKSISDASKPLEAARRARILADNKAGKISNVEAIRQMEGYEVHAELKPLQDKLLKLRQEEDSVRKSLPAKPEAKTSKTLHLEEIQSDWATAIRKHGYKGEKEKLQSDFDKIEKKIVDSNDEIVMSQPDIKDALKMAADKKIITNDEAKLYERYTNIENSNPAPDMPFKRSWSQVAIKRILHKAASEGYEGVSYTPGAEQAARYDLSKQVKSIHWQPSPADKDASLIQIHPNDGKVLKLQVNKSGKVVASFPSSQTNQFEGKNLADVIGKEHADKILGKKDGSLEGEGLKIGGEGMHAFYDKILKDEFNNIGKKYGSKIEEKTIGIPHKNGEQGKDLKIPYFRITPEMREKAKGGFPLFSSSPVLSPITYNPFDKEKKNYKLVPVVGNPFQE